MKGLILCLIVLAAVVAADAQNQTAATAAIKKVSAKDVKALIDSSTGPTIINFWASWCGPCIREIPWFDSIIAKKNAPVKLVLVSLDFAVDYPANLTAFVKKQGYHGEVVYLSDINSSHYIPIIEKKWSGAIPASIFVNHSKKYYQVFNHQLPKERFALELDKLLE